MTQARCILAARFVSALFASMIALTAIPALAQSRPRAVVLRFEGWRAEQARRAAMQGLEQGYELVPEQALVDTASRLGVDVSTPEGMATVVEDLRVELVVGGFVEGTGRRATTTVWIMDIRGNELTRRTTSAPSGRGGTQDIAVAASEAAAEGIAVLHRPPPEPIEVPRDEPETAHEVAPDHHMMREDVDVSGRWNQPIVRALAGLRIRNRTAAISPNAEQHRFDADFFPDIQLAVELRPLALSPGAERGLYFAVSGGFSAGLSYVRRDGQTRDMMTYDFEVDAGYGLVLAEMVELVFSAGFGIDGFDLSDWLPTPGAPDFASTLYTYIRPAVQGRIRLVPNHLLVAELGFGGRIVVDSGPIQYLGPDGTSNGGIDLFLGLAGQLDIGFSWAARFAYQSYFLGFSGMPAVAESGTDESIQIWLMVGWSF
ncbi:hypothetical protein [Sandaracinus amylolyticus]|uniref:Uncharacterized protein n=1 Tax=Sandaracinus amylolyticus TaxID=927083 RepID=A0A0F6W6E9_9BACT|nr:hypothetical protein [Sandaracinus amylolyticus]AKF08496.1 hypothetical protein DB32_005645 [Sandaracinus amylolyticus]